MIAALFAAWTASALLAWALARRRPEHKPVAWLLSAGLSADAAYQLLVTSGAGVLGSHAGAILANALALVWPTALVAAALRVYLGQGPSLAIGAAGAALGLLALGPPMTTDDGTPVVLTAVQVLAAGSSTVLASVWYGAARMARRQATSAHFALTAIVVTEVLSLFGAWRIGPRDHWWVAQVLYLTMLGMITFIQGRFLCSPQPSPS